jgi:hypothetical protein
MREGRPSKNFSHLGVHNICLGPSSPVLPGPRLKMVMYNDKDEVIRRLEEVEGECLDPGYVDFFNSPKCRPAVYQHHIVDIAPDGTQTILSSNPERFGRDPGAWIELVGKWANEHAIKEGSDESNKV